MMNMTPVRVRGKNRREKARAEQEIGARPRDKIRDRPHRRSRVSNSKIAETATMQQPTPKLSRLESLPIELLTDIFLQCLNISLPQASLPLGNALGSQSLKIELFLKAFTSQDDDLLHRDELCDILQVDEQVSVRAQIGYLQSRILRLRWLDWGFVKLCMESFAASALMRAFRDQSWKWLDGMPVQNRVMQDFVHGIFAPEVLEAKQILVRQRGLAEWSNPPVEPLTTASLRMWRWDSPATGNQLTLGLAPRKGCILLMSCRLGAEDPTEIDTCDTCCWRLFFPMETCDIPKKLLQGPWTDSKLNLLEALVGATSFVDWEGSLSGETAMQGLEDAVREESFRAVDLLTKELLMAQSIYPSDPHFIEPSFIDATFGSSNEPDPLPLVRINLVNGVNIRHTCEVEPSEEHLKIAVLERGCDRQIVHRLLWAERSSTRDWVPAEIISWAVEKREQHDERGQWLLDAIEDATNWDYRRYLSSAMENQLLLSDRQL